MSKGINTKGIRWKREGNFLYVQTDRGRLAYLKWLNPEMLSHDLIKEDYDCPFPFRYDTNTIKTAAGISIEVPVELMEFSRINKHGVEFTLNGVRFIHDDMLYEFGLPYQVDMSHSYTPELLIQVMEDGGTYSHHSQMWVKPGIKNKSVKTN